MKDNKRPWNDGDPAEPYSVTLWYDVPGESDSCSTGCDFATEKEARACLADMGAYFNEKAGAAGCEEVAQRVGGWGRVRRRVS